MTDDAGRAAQQLDVIDNPTSQVLDQEIIPAGRPVLIEGGLDDWPALACWSPQYLLEKAGDRRVRVTHSPEGVYNAARYVPMTMRDFLGHLSEPDGNPDQYYISGIEIAHDLPELADDVRTPDCIDDGRVDARHLFIGGASTTGCHFHPYHQNILCQLAGRKSVRLFGPDDFGKLYPKPLWDEQFNWTRIDNLNDYDRYRYPKVARAQAIDVTLEAGMMLHIPIHWWHFVCGESFSMSLAFFWKAPVSQWRFPHPGLRAGLRAVLARVRTVFANGLTPQAATDGRERTAELPYRRAANR